MSQHLAIDWSLHEVRYVLATGKGTGLKVTAAGALPIPSTDENAKSADSIGRVLRDALAPHKVGKAKALVGVSRGSVELHRLSLPPASDAELPILVANQIAREFSTAADASIVDYVADAPVPNQGRQVTAAVFSAEQHDFVKAVCTAAGVVAHRIVLRPYATANLYCFAHQAQPGAALLVNIVEDEVDLTIVDGAKVTFSRTVRFPQNAETSRLDDWLVAEVSRTLLAAPKIATESAGTARVCLFGSASEHRSLSEAIQRKLQLTVESITPFDVLGGSPESSATNSGRFASLLGLVSAEARAASHEIDFVNPRRPPIPKNRKRPIIVAAAAVALAAVGYGYSIWDELAQADAQISDLKQQVKTLNEQIKKVETKQAVVDSIAEWQAGDVVWLDELRDLSQKLPGSRDLTVMRMSMSPSRSGGGVVTLQGAARSWTVVERMSNNLRDEFHQVGVPHQQGRNQDEARGWHFDTSIAVVKREKDTYLPAPPESEVADQKEEGRSAAANTKAAAN